MRRPLVAHVIATPGGVGPMRRLLIRPVRLAQDARKKAEEKEAKAKAKAEKDKAKAEAKAVR